MGITCSTDNALHYKLTEFPGGKFTCSCQDVRSNAKKMTCRIHVWECPIWSVWNNLLSAMALNVFLIKYWKEQNRRSFSICYSTRIIVVRFVKPKGATSSKFHNIQFVRILVCCIILSLDYLIYFNVFEAFWGTVDDNFKIMVVIKSSENPVLSPFELKCCGNIISCTRD